MSDAEAKIASDQLRARIPKHLDGDERLRWCEKVAMLAAQPLDPDAHAKWEARLKEVYGVGPPK